MASAAVDNRPWAQWSEEHQAPLCPACGRAMKLLPGKPERWHCSIAAEAQRRGMFEDPTKRLRHTEVTIYKRAGSE